jgi:hypothetical protein
MSKVVEVPGVGNVEFPDEMSDEAIGQAISKSVPPPQEKEGLLRKVARYVGETGAGLVTGAGRIATAADPALAAVGAAGSYLVPNTGSGSFGSRWKNEMEGLRRGREETRAESPIAHNLGTVAPLALLPEALATIPSTTATLGAAAPLATRMAAGTVDAALFNAASAAGEQADRNPAGAALTASASPTNLVGAALPLAGRALPQVGAALKAAALKRLPTVEPSPAAATLRKMGVEGMTLGQQAPASAIGHIEEAAANRLGGMAPERAAAVSSWREAALKKALPPGMTELPKGSIQERLAAINEGFEPAYAAVKSEPVFPAIHAGGRGIPLQGSRTTPGAFDQAVMDAGVTATAAERRIAKSFLDNQLTLLPGGKQRPGMVAPVTAGDLLTMRSNIRAEAHSNRLSGDDKIARLLENGEEAITKALESQLRPVAQAALKAADRQYAQFKTVQDAAARSGLEGEFTPYQLGAELKAAAGKPAFARGYGGDLRSLAQAGQTVFATRVPKTGYAGALMDQIPAMKYMPGGIGTRLLNSPSIRSAILGQRAPEVGPVRDVPGTPGSFQGLMAILRGDSGDEDPAANSAALVEALRQRKGQTP